MRHQSAGITSLFAVLYIDACGGTLWLQAVWNAYVLSMRQAGFTSAVPMYAASGLLTYGASEDMDHIIATLQAAGLCSEVLYKELYIPQPELDGAPACVACFRCRYARRSAGFSSWRLNP